MSSVGGREPLWDNLSLGLVQDANQDYKIGFKNPVSSALNTTKAISLFAVASDANPTLQLSPGSSAGYNTQAGTINFGFGGSLTKSYSLFVQYKDILTLQSFTADGIIDFAWQTSLASGGGCFLELDRTSSGNGKETGYIGFDVMETFGGMTIPTASQHALGIIEFGGTVPGTVRPIIFGMVTTGSPYTYVEAFQIVASLSAPQVLFSQPIYFNASATPSSSGPGFGTDSTPNLLANIPSGAFYIGYGGTYQHVFTSTTYYPNNDNTIGLGSPTARWVNINAIQSNIYGAASKLFGQMGIGSSANSGYIAVYDNTKAAIAYYYSVNGVWTYSATKPT